MKRKFIMSYRLRIPEHDVFEKCKFVNSKGSAECVEFVRQSTGAPGTYSCNGTTKVK
jgi:hypothetical protein